MSFSDDFYDDAGIYIMLDDPDKLKTLIGDKELSEEDIELFLKCAEQFSSKKIIAYVNSLKK